MRLTNTLAFDKHLKEAFPDNLSLLYFISMPSEAERKKITNRVIFFLQKIEPQALSYFLTAEENSISSLLETLNTKPLIGNFSIVVFEGVEHLKKADLQRLEAYLINPSSTSYLIMGGASLKGFSEKIKKEMIILDLSDEKPWDKQSRLREWVITYAAREKKRLEPSLVSWFFTHIGSDLLALEQELNKLITYTLGKETIELKDALALSGAKEQISSWQLAESLVWEEFLTGEPPISDTSSLLGFIGQIRYQLEIGAKIASFQLEGFNASEMSDRLPQLKAGLLQKKLDIVRKRHPYFFKNALKELFYLEIRLKTTSIDPRLLFNMFVAKL